MKHKLAFKFSGKMARLLGSESVSNDVAALFELVKNAYDADATYVSIKFKNFSPNNSKDGQIVIEDDGEGMSFDELEKKWMVIGTYSKDEKIRTRRNRRMVGNKGIGRFATEKLAKNISLISRSKKNQEEIRLEIDWSRYENKKLTFDKIEHDIDVQKIVNKPYQQGTKIILKNIKENWNVEKILDLKNAIGSIILPHELLKATGDQFGVTVSADNFNTGSEKQVQSLLFKHAPYKLTAIILNNNYKPRVKLYKFKKLVHEELLDLKNKDLHNGEIWSPFGKCIITIYFFPGPSKREEIWKKYYRTALKSLNINKTLKDLHGVKIYRDSFWVRPYGKVGNDWLDLDKKRVQSNLKVGNTQVIGTVQITQDNNPTIIDTTTREGLINNNSFKSLHIFVKKSIDVLSNYRIDEYKKYREDGIKIEHKNTIDVESDHLLYIFNDLDIPLEKKKEIKKSITKIKKVFLDYNDKNEENMEEMINIERALRNLASLGISTATTMHEIGNTMAILSDIPGIIRKDLKLKPIPMTSIIHNLNLIDKDLDSIKDFMTYVNQYVQNLRNDYVQKQKKMNIRIEPIVESVVKRFKPLLEELEIDLKQTYYPKEISAYMNRADFTSIFINLLSNSIRMLSKHDSIKKKIKITAENSAKNFKLKFSDNGPGINENNRDKVFRLFYTTTKEGTGLGLPIVKEIVEEYDGSIKIKTSELENGATFEVLIPLRGV